MPDAIVVGGGPAGLSAAITLRQRGNSVAVVTTDAAASGLYKARKVDNYPGLPGLSGAELLERFLEHARGVGVEFMAGQATSVLPMGETIGVAFGSEVLTSACVILATGVAQTSLFDGEEDFLGRGVSYCATCDGMLYRGKRVCVACLAPHADDEAEHLRAIGCDVVAISPKDMRIIGDEFVSAVVADGVEIACDGVFIIRSTVAPHLLVAGIDTEGGYIRASASGETSIAGVFAAGDCVGPPLQVAKAVGQGLSAALSASEYIAKR
ncbi:MAG: FAD-dependent oxidoreductase [Oscillospiraceae bacterium]|nr:FAD-dependent oxidoreductase [Oscillospiraceae bacterium]